MNIRYASLTDVGVRRSHNQDACATQPAADPAHWKKHGHVFIVADGMGGHAVGEKASAKAVRDIPLTYLKHAAIDGFGPAIRRAFTEANAAIFGIGQNNPEFKGLGTTATGLFLCPDGVWVGHVGDSRAYRIRGPKVQQLTFDHSWVWEVARRQGIDPDELGDFKRNVIIRSLGPDLEVEVDVEGPHPAEPGDSFLLCSDGLSNLITPDEIGAIVNSFSPEEACKYLVALANVRGGPDNITALIVQIPGAGGARGFKKSRTGIVRRTAKLGRAFNRVVPWPFAMLGVGALVAGLSVWLQMEKQASIAIAAFAVAAVLILVGLTGLYLHLRKRAEESDDTPTETTPELHLYRDYEFAPGKALVDRFAGLCETIKAAIKGRVLEIDWKAYEKDAADAQAAGKREDWSEAFKSQFLALQALAVAVNKVRQKDEVFTPNWTGHPKSQGG